MVKSMKVINSDSKELLKKGEECVYVRREVESEEETKQSTEFENKSENFNVDENDSVFENVRDEIYTGHKYDHLCPEFLKKDTAEFLNENRAHFEQSNTDVCFRSGSAVHYGRVQHINDTLAKVCSIELRLDARTFAKKTLAEKLREDREIAVKSSDYELLEKINEEMKGLINSQRRSAINEFESVRLVEEEETCELVNVKDIFIRNEHPEKDAPVYSLKGLYQQQPESNLSDVSGVKELFKADEEADEIYSLKKLMQEKKELSEIDYSPLREVIEEIEEHQPAEQKMVREPEVNVEELNQEAYKNCPDFIRAEVVEYLRNKHTIQFSEKSVCLTNSKSILFGEIYRVKNSSTIYKVVELEMNTMSALTRSAVNSLENKQNLVGLDKSEKNKLEMLKSMDQKAKYINERESAHLVNKGMRLVKIGHEAGAVNYSDLETIFKDPEEQTEIDYEVVRDVFEDPEEFENKAEELLAEPRTEPLDLEQFSPCHDFIQNSVSAYLRKSHPNLMNYNDSNVCFNDSQKILFGIQIRQTEEESTYKLHELKMNMMSVMNRVVINRLEALENPNKKQKKQLKNMKEFHTLAEYFDKKESEKLLKNEARIMVVSKVEEEHEESLEQSVIAQEEQTFDVLNGMARSVSSEERSEELSLEFNNEEEHITIGTPHLKTFKNTDRIYQNPCPVLLEQKAREFLNIDKFSALDPKAREACFHNGYEIRYGSIVDHESSVKICTMTLKYNYMVLQENTQYQKYVKERAEVEAGSDKAVDLEHKIASLLIQLDGKEIIDFEASEKSSSDIGCTVFEEPLKAIEYADVKTEEIYDSSDPIYNKICSRTLFEKVDEFMLNNISEYVKTVGEKICFTNENIARIGLVHQIDEARSFVCSADLYVNLIPLRKKQQYEALLKSKETLTENQENLVEAIDKKLNQLVAEMNQPIINSELSKKTLNKNGCVVLANDKLEELKKAPEDEYQPMLEFFLPKFADEENQSSSSESDEFAEINQLIQAELETYSPEDEIYQKTCSDFLRKVADSYIRVHVPDFDHEDEKACYFNDEFIRYGDVIRDEYDGALICTVDLKYNKELAEKDQKYLEYVNALENLRPGNTRLEKFLREKIQELQAVTHESLIDREGSNLNARGCVPVLNEQPSEYTMEFNEIEWSDEDSESGIQKLQNLSKVSDFELESNIDIGSDSETDEDYLPSLIDFSEESSVESVIPIEEFDICSKEDKIKLIRALPVLATLGHVMGIHAYLENISSCVINNNEFRSTLRFNDNYCFLYFTIDENHDVTLSEMNEDLKHLSCLNRYSN